MKGWYLDDEFVEAVWPRAFSNEELKLRIPEWNRGKGYYSMEYSFVEGVCYVTDRASRKFYRTIRPPVDIPLGSLGSLRIRSAQKELIERLPLFCLSPDFVQREVRVGILRSPEETRTFIVAEKALAEFEKIDTELRRLRTSYQEALMNGNVVPLSTWAIARYGEVTQPDYWSMHRRDYVYHEPDNYFGRLVPPGLHTAAFGGSEEPGMYSVTPVDPALEILVIDQMVVTPEGLETMKEVKAGTVRLHRALSERRVLE